MKTVNIQDAKTHLSRYLEAVAAGEVVVICRRNVPIAELRALPRGRRSPRTVGVRDDFEVGEAFFAPLPDDVIAGFEGEG